MGYSERGGGSPDNFAKGYVDETRLYEAKKKASSDLYTAESDSMMTPEVQEEVRKFLKSVGMPLLGGLEYFDMLGVSKGDPTIASEKLSEATNAYIEKVGTSAFDLKMKKFLLKYLRLQFVNRMIRKENVYNEDMDSALEKGSKYKMEDAEQAKTAVLEQDEAAKFIQQIDQVLADLPPEEKLAA